MIFIVSEWRDKSFISGILGTELDYSVRLFTPTYAMNYFIYI